MIIYSQSADGVKINMEDFVKEMSKVALKNKVMYKLLKYTYFTVLE